jgi:hypothetical protein
MLTVINNYTIAVELNDNILYQGLPKTPNLFGYLISKENHQKVLSMISINYVSEKNYFKQL